MPVVAREMEPKKIKDREKYNAELKNLFSFFAEKEHK
jgi:hypothetical protein